MDRRAVVEKALKNAKSLPAGPAVMSKISELCRDPRASARDLGKVLQLDTALTTRVLKQVNSAFYGLSATIKTVTHAVVILGFQEIKHIALSVPVAGLYEDHAHDPGIDIQALWEKTLASACLARALSYHVRYPVPEQIFVSGILADAGMVILNSILGEEYRTVVESCPEDDFLPEIEQAELGINHIEVGRRLAEKWHFPPELVQAITCHHDPLQGEVVLIESGLVHVGRRLQELKAKGDDPVLLLPELPAPIAEALHLTPEAVRTAFEKAVLELDAAKQMLSSME